MGENRGLSNGDLPAESTFGKDRHRRAARMVLCALTAATSSAWDGLAVVLSARLSVRERCFLAFAALASLDAEARDRTFAAVNASEAREPDPFDSDLWREVCAEYHRDRLRGATGARVR